MAKLKTWSGLIYLRGKQIHATIATTSKKKAVEILGISYSEFNNYWSESINKLQVAITTAEPETIFITHKPYKTNTVYEKYEPTR